MKLKLPTAAELRKKHGKAVASKRESLKTFVTRWLNTEVLTEIGDAMEDAEHSQGVMVKSPMEAYEWGTAFYIEVQDQLLPLGYTAEQSHDGGGMYATCYISWEAPIKKPRTIR